MLKWRYIPVGFKVLYLSYKTRQLMLYREIIVLCSWMSKVVRHKKILYLINANPTNTLCPYISNRWERKKGDIQQNVKKCKHVTKRSAAVWRLPPSVWHQQYYCTLSANSLRTANCWQCAPHHREMFWCKLVASSLSPPGVVCDNCPVWNSSHPHPKQPFSITWKSRFLQTSIFRGRPF